MTDFVINMVELLLYFSVFKCQMDQDFHSKSSVLLVLFNLDFIKPDLITLFSFWV